MKGSINSVCIDKLCIEFKETNKLMGSSEARILEAKSYLAGFGVQQELHWVAVSGLSTSQHGHFHPEVGVEEVEDVLDVDPKEKSTEPTKNPVG